MNRPVGFFHGQHDTRSVPDCRKHAAPTLLEDSGFARVGRTVPVDAVMQGRAYLESRGPLDPGWRRGDSVWSTVSADRLEAVCERVRRLDRAGRLDAFVREHDAPRDYIGQMTFVHAVRA